MHIEAAKGDSNTARGYCKGPWESKDKKKSKPLNDEYWEQGTYKHFDAVKKGQRSDIDQLKADIQSGHTYEQVRDDHFPVVARYDQFVRKFVQDTKQKAVIDELRLEFSSASLRPWQQELLQRMDMPAGDRTVEWIWEEVGNVGKSWMGRYLAVIKDALILGTGKFADLAYIFTNDPRPIVVFDLSRVVAPTEDLKTTPVKVLYSLCEQLKNGQMTNTKYWSASTFFKPPHVVFFANFPNDSSCLSKDRWRVTELGTAAQGPP